MTAAPLPSSSTQPVKAWVHDFPAFVNAGGGRNWIVGRSAGPCLSQREASAQAIRNAVEQLCQHLDPHSPTRPPLPGGHDLIERDDHRAEADAWLRNRLSGELKSGRLIEDRHLSVTKRPYGDLWSAAILVDASSPRVDSIAREHAAVLRHRREAHRDTAFSIVGLSAAILLVYAGVNMATRGYFRGRLRAGAGVAMGLGALFLIWLSNGAG